VKISNLTSWILPGLHGKTQMKHLIKIRAPRPTLHSSIPFLWTRQHPTTLLSFHRHVAS